MVRVMVRLVSGPIVVVTQDNVLVRVRVRLRLRVMVMVRVRVRIRIMVRVARTVIANIEMLLKTV